MCLQPSTVKSGNLENGYKGAGSGWARGFFWRVCWGWSISWKVVRGTWKCFVSAPCPSPARHPGLAFAPCCFQQWGNPRKPKQRTDAVLKSTSGKRPWGATRNRESKLSKPKGRKLLAVNGHLMAGFGLTLDQVFKSPGSSAVNAVPPAARWWARQSLIWLGAPSCNHITVCKCCLKLIC